MPFFRYRNIYQLVAIELKEKIRFLPYHFYLYRGFVCGRRKGEVEMWNDTARSGIFFLPGFNSPRADNISVSEKGH